MYHCFSEADTAAISITTYSSQMTMMVTFDNALLDKTSSEYKLLSGALTNEVCMIF